MHLKERLDYLCRMRKVKFGFQLVVAIMVSSLLFSCGGKSSSTEGSVAPLEKDYYHGIGSGPVMSLELDDAIDGEMASRGKELFESRCTSCHAYADERRVGPGLRGITQRRKPEYIMNQILNPIEMAKHDSLAKELLAVYLVQMVPMGFDEQQARSVLEYFRKMDKTE